jgi:hypothetical protein
MKNAAILQRFIAGHNVGTCASFMAWGKVHMFVWHLHKDKVTGADPSPAQRYLGVVTICEATNHIFCLASLARMNGYRRI